ncbi:MAG: metalloprotease TldD [Betaproteobacteria bacterium]
MTDLSIPGVHGAALDAAASALLLPYGLDIAALADVLGAMHTHQVDYADLYFQYARSEGWSLEEGIVKAGSFHIDQGVGVRAVSGEKTAFAYSDEVSLKALHEAAAATRAIGRQGKSACADLTTGARFTPEQRLYSDLDPLASLPDPEKVALLGRLERMARAKDSRVTQVMASLGAEFEIILVARSDGVVAADVRPLVRVSLQVIVEQNGRREQGRSGGGGRHGYGRFTDALLQTYVDSAVHTAVTNLEARDAPAGTTTVVLASGWPGILLHEAIGHGLEGDFNRIGERVAAKGVTVVDDGTLADRRGSLNVDDEGSPTARTVLIQDGILMGYMQDTMNARLMGAAVTGNGRRESYASLPMPRMTNTLMENGDRDPGEIIASVKDGIYAVSFEGGQVDITNGKFVFSASEAYRIENGRVTYPVRGATLIGNGPDALTRVAMVGNDLAMDLGVGVCGKEGQSVPVGVGQPTLRLDAITVGGTA